jgi:hypothetical protein
MKTPFKYFFYFGVVASVILIPFVDTATWYLWYAIQMYWLVIIVYILAKIEKNQRRDK